MIIDADRRIIVGEYGPWQISNSPVDNLTHVDMRAALTRLSGLPKQKKDNNRREEEEIT